MMTAGFVVCFQFNQLSCFLGVAQSSAFSSFIALFYLERLFLTHNGVRYLRVGGRG